MSEPRERGRILERIYAHGIWVAHTPLHIGGGDTDPDGPADMLLLADAARQFYIPGASIAGAGRSYLARLRNPAEEFRKGIASEPKALQFLFGAGDEGYASPLTIEDARLAHGSAQGRLIRDGVRIDAGSGSAARNAKYNIEVMARGARFEFRLSLVVYRDLNGLDRDGLVSEFLALLRAFETDGEIPLGARTRRGLGGGSIEGGWKIWRLDMQNRDHLAAWLGRSWEETIAVTPLQSMVATPLPSTDHRRRVSIDARLRLKTSLLVRKAGATAGDPDTVQLVEQGTPIAPGSSLAGILRHRCRRIALTLLDEPSAEVLINKMFGPIHEKKGRGESLPAGRVRVWDAEMPKSELLVQGRVAIDRFTGGALEGRLFDEAAYWPSPHPEGDLRVRIDLEEPDAEDRETALLLLAFKDFYTGDLPLGGETGAGRGVLDGVCATISGPGREPWEFAGAWPSAAPSAWESGVRVLNAGRPR